MLGLCDSFEDTGVGSLPMDLEDKVEWLNALLEQVYPDPVDFFEDLLADRLGYYRHPETSYKVWRSVRVALIESAGSRADELAKVVEEELGA